MQIPLSWSDNLFKWLTIKLTNYFQSQNFIFKLVMTENTCFSRTWLTCMRAPLSHHSNLQGADLKEHVIKNLSETHSVSLKSTPRTRYQRSTYHTYQRKKNELCKLHIPEFKKKSIYSKLHQFFDRLIYSQEHQKIINESNSLTFIQWKLGS